MISNARNGANRFIPKINPWRSIRLTPVRVAVASILLMLGLLGCYRGWRANRLVKASFATIAAAATSDANLAERLTWEIHKRHREYVDQLKVQGLDDPVSSRNYHFVDYILTHGGICGHRSLLLITALRTYGIPARKLLLVSADHQFCTHVVVEARIDGKWRVLDPLFGYVFRRADGELATERSEERRTDLDACYPKRAGSVSFRLSGRCVQLS